MGKKKRVGRRARRNAADLLRKKVNQETAMKKPIALAAKMPGHAMHRDSALAVYWLSLFALVVLGMLLSVLVGVLQLAISDARLLIIVAMLGLFFGYVANNLVSLIENLEAKHHFFARLFVPTVSVLNLLIISSAAANLALSLRLPTPQSPLAITLVYAVSLALPAFPYFLSFNGIPAFGRRP